jgi:Phosphodiester glycosidase
VILRSPVGAWLQTSGRLAATVGVLSAWASIARGPAPGRDLTTLSRALGRSAGDSVVSAADIRWEPSGGAIADVAVGRWVLFLARDPGEDARDVWRARARVAPEGAVIEVLEAHDLTNTPLGDDHELVIRGTHAAFATRAYSQEQSLTALDLGGEGGQNRAEAMADRAMAAITNLLQTGTAVGVGRVDVTLESPAGRAGLVLDGAALDIALYDGDRHREASVRNARLDLARGELVSAPAGMRADASMHLPKRFSHWTVDTLRAVSWIGPAPIAWLEEQALAARDVYRRFTFRAGSDAANVVVGAEPPPPPLDTSQASVEEAHWPPPHIATIWKSPQKGEGEWAAPDVPWLRKVPSIDGDAPLAFYVTFLRPDDERPYSKVLLVAMDTRQLDLDMEAGIEDPEPLTGPHGPGRIPRDPSIYRRVAAAFNGAFKTEHGHYGMMVHKHVLLPPVPGAATVAVLDDGRVAFGTWAADSTKKRAAAGIDGLDDDAIVSFRQNLDPLIDHGQINPTGRNLWGFTLPGKGAQTERSGLCVTTSGHLIYAWGDDVSATALARAMKMAGCDYAMHLDMNPYHTGFLFTAIDDLPAKKYKSQLLTSGMSIPVDRYIQYAPKDFFYVMVHDPSPPAVAGWGAWEPDGGTQPPPRWIPGLWHTRTEQGIDVYDVEPDRVTWRIRAGTQESPASNPLRELAGDEAKRALLAVGAGIALGKKPRGISTDGRLAVPVHGGAESGALVVGQDGKLVLVRATEAEIDGPHDDMLELPILRWDGKPYPSAEGAVAPRAAIGVTPSGRVVIVRGSFASAAPLGEALARAGCSSALSLDRGAGASAFTNRAGTAYPPRGRYDESVLYAIATSLRPRGFRF